MGKEDPLGLDNIKHEGDADKALILSALRRLADSATEVEHQLKTLIAIQVKQEEHDEKLVRVFNQLDELLDNRGEVRRLGKRISIIEDQKWRAVGWMLTTLFVAIGGLSLHLVGGV